MVAQTYRARGELVRAGRITQQVLRLSPLDVSMRSWLIELLVEQHKTEEALQQFFELADTYYQLADLESAPHPPCRTRCCWRRKTTPRRVGT